MSPFRSGTALREHGRVVVVLRIDHAEPVLAGHFPGFAIFPGVGLLRCAEQAARAALGDPPVELAAIESARFVAPVFPGDRVIAESTEARSGDGWRCSVRLTVARLDTTELAAVVRLHFRPAAPP
jgi:3-hydroxyacyl-[acyl-carrier-protein] dehydratase